MSLFASSTPQKPAFTFPTPAATTTPTGGLFGTTAPAKPLFGSTTQASSTPSLFGSTTTTTPSGGLFGKTATTTTTTSSAGTLFGAPAATSTAQPSLFGSTTTSSLAFPSTTTTTAPLFGSTSTAAKPTTTGGLFGSTTGSSLGGLGGGLGLQQQQQPQPQQQQFNQQQIIQQMPIVRAMANPQVMGNDNDRFIAYINQVAGGLGVGKAPYKENNQVRTFDMEGNVLQRFVSIGYNKISERTDDEGFVTMVMGYPIDELNTEERRAKILEAIRAILGNPQNVQVLYAPGTSLRPLPDGCTELTIIVKEAGFVVGACKLAQVLNDAPRMTQLEQQLKVDKTRVLPKVGMSKAQKEHYMETVPEGVDANLWAQAKAENPASNKLLPVVVRGWEQLRDRQKAQVQETKIYTDAMDTLGDRIEQSLNEHAKANVAMEMIRNRHKQLSYRLIRILLAQWIASRYSRQIDTEEDRIHAKCDTLLAQMNRHNQVKYWVDRFYKVIEERPDRLRETMFTMFDMSMEDEQYALRFLTQMVYVCEELYATSNLQVTELEECRKALEG